MDGLGVVMETPVRALFRNSNKFTYNISDRVQTS